MLNKKHQTTYPFCLVFLLSFAATICIAQEVVILEKKSDYSIKVESGRLKIINSFQSSKLFYSNTNKHSREHVFYSSLDPLLEIEAYSKVPDQKGKYKTFKPKVYETKDIVEPSIFYGGHKVKEFVYPSLIPNSIGYFEYTKSIKDPHVIGSFYFDDRYDVKKSTFIVTTSKDVELAFDLFNIEDYSIKYNKEVIKNEIIHSWVAMDLKKAARDDKGPSRPYRSPHIILRIKTYDTSKGKISVSDSVKDLFTWYNSLLKRIPNSNSEPLSNEVKGLVEGIDSNEEKIEILYSWVQSNIKYVAFEDGMAGFIPRSAGDVYSKKYGDCKDMANLLKTMLQMADIPAFLTWVGTNSKPYSYIDVPCTLTDNHMICSTLYEGEYTYLDPTNPFLKFKTSPKLLQGKEALIKTGEQSFTVDTIPETSFELNSRSDVLNLKIDDDALVGEVHTTLEGYLIEDFKFNLIKDEYKNRSNGIQEYLCIGNATTSINSIKSESLDKQHLLSFNGRFEQEMIKAGSKLYVNLNLDPSHDSFRIKDLETRNQSIQKDYKYVYTLSSTLDIPEGYSLEYMPEKQSFSHNLFSIDSGYKIENNTVIFNKKIVSNFLLLKPEYFDEYRKFFFEILKSKKQKITLIKS